jgi:hypothetical protein
MMLCRRCACRGPRPSALDGARGRLAVQSRSVARGPARLSSRGGQTSLCCRAVGVAPWVGIQIRSRVLDSKTQKGVAVLRPHAFIHLTSLHTFLAYAQATVVPGPLLSFLLCVIVCLMSSISTCSFGPTFSSPSASSVSNFVFFDYLSLGCVCDVWTHRLV